MAIYKTSISLVNKIIFLHRFGISLLFGAINYYIYIPNEALLLLKYIITEEIPNITKFHAFADCQVVSSKSCVVHPEGASAACFTPRHLMFSSLTIPLLRVNTMPSGPPWIHYGDIQKC